MTNKKFEKLYILFDDEVINNLRAALMSDILRNSVILLNGLRNGNNALDETQKRRFFNCSDEPEIENNIGDRYIKLYNENQVLKREIERLKKEMMKNENKM